jgi:phage tail sheath gpL-like
MATSMTITVANGSSRSSADIALELQVPADNDRRAFESLSSFFARLGGGFHKGSDQITGSTVSVNLDISSGTLASATGVVTCASVANNDTVTVNGVVFTAKTSGPTGDQFLVGVSNTADGAALAACINASTTAGASGVFQASAAAGVVTITSSVAGLIGNSIQVKSSNGTRLAVTGTSTRDSLTYLSGGTGGSTTNSAVQYVCG